MHEFEGGWQYLGGGEQELFWFIWRTVFCWCSKGHAHPLNRFWANNPIVYLLKAQRTIRKVVWCFQGVENWNNDWKWVLLALCYLKILCFILISCYVFRKMGWSAIKWVEGRGDGFFHRKSQIRRVVINWNVW